MNSPRRHWRTRDLARTMDAIGAETDRAQSRTVASYQELEDLTGGAQNEAPPQRISASFPVSLLTSSREPRTATPTYSTSCGPVAASASRYST